MRAVVYSAADTRLFELRSDEILECRMDETINGERAVTITTTRELEKGQRVLIRPDGGEWSEWCMEGADEGRPYGAASGTYYLPWSLKSDLEGVICSKMPGTKTPVDACSGLEAALSGTKRWQIGDVSVYNTGGVSMWNVSGWKALSLVTKTWGGELDSEITVNKSRVTNRIVHLRDQLGSKVAVHRFEYSHDLKDVSRVVADQRVYCRVIPRGKGESTEDGGTGRKIGIEPVNGGSSYIEDAEAAQAFRVPSGNGWEYPTVIIENGNIEDPAELKAWALSVLHNYTTPQVSYKASVVTLGFTPSLGDVVHVVDNGFIGGGIRLQARVQRIVTNLLDPTDVQVYLGNITNGLPGMFSSLDAKISNAVNQAKQDITAQVDTALSNLDIELDMTEIDRRFDAAEAAYEEVKAEADATRDSANTLAAQITQVTTTVNGTVLPGMQTLETSISGAVSDASAAVQASSTVTQTVNGIIAGTSQDYTSMVGNITNSLKQDSTLAITPSAIEGVVTANYINSNLSGNTIDGLVGSRYIARTSTYQTADSIVTSATGTAKTYTDNELLQYTKTAQLSIEAGSIKSNVLAILNDSYGGGSGADPYIRASNVTLTDSAFSILFSEGMVGGGINMLLDSNVGSLEKLNGPANRSWSNSSLTFATAPTFVDITNPPVVGIKKGIRFTVASGETNSGTAATNAKCLRFYYMSSPLPVLPLEDGETYTVSCYARKVSGNTARTFLWVAGMPPKNADISSTNWKKHSYTFTWDETAAESDQYASVRGCVYIGILPRATGTFELCGFKLEHGPVATDWTLNPIEYTAETIAAQNSAQTAYNHADDAYLEAAAAQYDASKALSMGVAIRGVCNTQSSSATKDVDLEYYYGINTEGNTITVYFTEASTSNAKIQLNVKSAGAKDIWVGGEVTSGTNRLMWEPGAQITFTYGGGHWNVVSEPRTWRATCQTAEGTANKEIVIDAMVRCKGTTIIADMEHKNTSSSVAIQVRYNSGNSTSTFTTTNVYAGSGNARPLVSNGLSWTDNSTVPLVYDGAYWRMGDSAAIARAVEASQTATNYMSFSSGGGLIVGDMTAQSLGSNIQILSNAINFRYGNAKLGTLDTISSDGNTYMRLNNGSNYGGVFISGTNLARLTASEVTGISGQSYVESTAVTEGTSPNVTETDSNRLHSYYKDPSNNNVYLAETINSVTSNGTSQINMRVQRGTTGYSGSTMAMLSLSASIVNNALKKKMEALFFDEIDLGRTVLYDNASGTNGDVTLNSDCTKFKRLRIYFRDNRGTACPAADFEQVSIGVCLNVYTVSESESSATYVKRTTYEVNTATKLVPLYAGQVGINHANGNISGTTSENNVIYVYRVEGHNMY